MASIILLCVSAICLLVAIAFVVKFYVDNNKSKKKSDKSENKTEITIEDGKKPAFDEKAKKDLIIAFVFMALYEVFFLISKHV